MRAYMFEFLIVKPIFNLLVFIYAIFPGHNFGLALIIFTIIIRILLYPLIKKQLHHTKAMRELQPEIKKIKKATKGNRQQEAMMTMELYKEREISQFAPLGIMVIQLVILIGLFAGLRRIVNDPQAVVDYAYGFIQNLSWMKQIAADISKFDDTLLGFVDLTRSALGNGAVYWPALFLVAGSAVTQYYSSKQLMPSDEKSRSLRQILKDAGEGKQADQSEVSAATGKTMRYFLPVMIFIFTIGIASALALYWFISGLIAYIQQAKILNTDEEELMEVADKTKVEKDKAIEGEVVETKKKPANKKKKPTSKKAKRRRKR